MMKKNALLFCPRCLSYMLRRRLCTSQIATRSTGIRMCSSRKGMTIELTICNKTSPAENSSPSFFFHRAMVPSVISGDSAGITILACRLSEP